MNIGPLTLRQAAARRGPRPGQRAFSLVELMVAVAVGMLLLVVLMQLLLGSLQVDRATSDISRMQESGRNAMDIIGRALRQAGARADTTFPFSGTPLAATIGANGAPDTLTVQYEAQSLGETDCTGTTRTAGTLVTMAFSVNTAVNPPVLNCSNGSTSVVLAENVEDLQLEFAIDSARDGSVDSYVAGPSASQMTQVAAVRVSLLVRGPTPQVAANGSQTYLFNGATVTKTDGYLRQVHTGTFTVRNQAG